MNTAKKIIAIISSAVILSGFFGFMFCEKKTESENENRKLEQFPELSFAALENGNFTSKLEEYLKDHFPLRDGFMEIKTGTELIAGYKKINGTFIGKDGRLFQEVPIPNGKELVSCVNELCENINNKDIVTSVMLVPTSLEIYKDELPDHADFYAIDQKASIDGILSGIEHAIPLDPTDALNKAKKDGNVFYMTDHHWTSFGAYAAYSYFCEKRGISYPELSQYEISSVSDCFYGTLYSKVVSETLPKDTVEKYELKGSEIKAFFGKNSDILEEAPYYAEEWLEKKDKYSYFGNGNAALIVLENRNAKTSDEIVVVKDSFANCFVPFLTEHYKKVHVIDTRYFNKIGVSDYVNENDGVTDILVLYGLNSLLDNYGIRAIY